MNVWIYAFKHGTKKFKALFPLIFLIGILADIFGYSANLLDYIGNCLVSLGKRITNWTGRIDYGEL